MAWRKTTTYGGEGGNESTYWINDQTGEMTWEDPSLRQASSGQLEYRGTFEGEGGGGANYNWYDTGSGTQASAAESGQFQDDKFFSVWNNPNADGWSKVRAAEERYGIHAVQQAMESGQLNHLGLDQAQLGDYVRGQRNTVEDKGFSVGGNQLGLWPVALGTAGFAGAAAAGAGGASTATGTAGANAAELAASFGGMDAAAVAGADYGFGTAAAGGTGGGMDFFGDYGYGEDWSTFADTETGAFDQFGWGNPDGTGGMDSLFTGGGGSAFTSDLLRGAGLAKSLLGGAGDFLGGMMPSANTAAAMAPILAAIAYAKNQGGFDTSRLESTYDQFDPNALAFEYDQNTSRGREGLTSSLTNRGVMGSSFGNMDITNFNTTRDMGRRSLINQGTLARADPAKAILDAQIKERALKNQLYGQSLLAIGNVFGGKK